MRIKGVVQCVCVLNQFDWCTAQPHASQFQSTSPARRRKRGFFMGGEGGGGFEIEGRMMRRVLKQDGRYKCNIDYKLLLQCSECSSVSVCCM